MASFFVVSSWKLTLYWGPCALATFDCYVLHSAQVMVMSFVLNFAFVVIIS